MSNTVTKRERVALKIGNIREYIQENPKAKTTSDQYGDTLWFDLTTWSDGSKSLGGYNSETKKKYKLGSVLPQREQEKTAGVQQPFETTTKSQPVADDLPF